MLPALSGHLVRMVEDSLYVPDRRPAPQFQRQRYGGLRATNGFYHKILILRSSETRLFYPLSTPLWNEHGHKTKDVR